jgi:hypothetical protein
VKIEYSTAENAYRKCEAVEWRARRILKIKTLLLGMPLALIY